MRTPPRAVRSGIEERIGHNSAQRRPTVTVVQDDMRVTMPYLAAAARLRRAPGPSHEPSRRSVSRTAAAGPRGPGDEITGYPIELLREPARRAGLPELVKKFSDTERQL